MKVRMVLDLDIALYTNKYDLEDVQSHVLEVLLNRFTVPNVGAIRSAQMFQIGEVTDGKVPVPVADSVKRVHRGREDSQQAVVDSSDGDLSVHPKGGGIHCPWRDAKFPDPVFIDCAGAGRAVQRPKSEASPALKTAQAVARKIGQVHTVTTNETCKAIQTEKYLREFAAGIDAEWKHKIKGIISRLTEIQKPPKLTGEAGGLKGKEEGAHGA